MNDLREGPIRTGKPSARISSRRLISSRLCSTFLPKPMPGSRMIRSSGMPGRARQSDAFHQLALHVLEQVLIFRADIGIAQLGAHLHAGGIAAVVHQDHRTFGFRNHLAQLGIGAQSPHIVDDVRARVQRLLRNGRPYRYQLKSEYRGNSSPAP